MSEWNSPLKIYDMLGSIGFNWRKIQWLYLKEDIPVPVKENEGPTIP